MQRLVGQNRNTVRITTHTRRNGTWVGTLYVNGKWHESWDGFASSADARAIIRQYWKMANRGNEGLKSYIVRHGDGYAVQKTEITQQGHEKQVDWREGMTLEEADAWSDGCLIARRNV